MLGEQMVELLAHRGERPCLDLDQGRCSANVDDEPAELDLEFVAGLGVELLQLGVERSFVQRADVRDRTSLGPPARAEEHGEEDRPEGEHRHRPSLNAIDRRQVGDHGSTADGDRRRAERQAER
jgi:hypothetical protein